jgi:hypothetical protein
MSKLPPSYDSTREQNTLFRTTFDSAVAGVNDTLVCTYVLADQISAEFDPEFETFNYMNSEEQAAFTQIMTSQRVTVSSVKELVLEAKIRYEAYASSTNTLTLKEIVNALQPVGQAQKLAKLQVEVNSLVVGLNTFQATFRANCKADGRQAKIDKANTWKSIEKTAAGVTALVLVVYLLVHLTPLTLPLASSTVHMDIGVISVCGWFYCRFVQEDEISRVKSYLANINTNLKQLEDRITKLKAQTNVDLASDPNADFRGPLFNLAKRCDRVIASCNKLLM